MRSVALALAGFCFWTVAANAEVYAYVNDQGQYVVAPEKPSNPMTEYSVLTDDGRFLRLVSPEQTARQNRIPIDHWRPWFIPKEPHPLDAQIPETEPVPSVTVEEVDEGEDGGN